jgi:glycerol-1-phosphate dehydrogenase [NAD(P)+]
MELPRKILIGDGVLRTLGGFIKEAGVTGKVVIASGTNVQERVRDIVARSLRNDADDNHDDGALVWVDVEASDMKNVKSVVREAGSASCIVGLGGGKSVDVGKLAAFRRGIQFFSVPTSAASDGISSPFASIHGTRRHYSFVTKPPVGILADVKVIADAPRRLLAAGCGELVSKLTAVRDWKLAHRATGEYFGGYAANLALMSAGVVLDSSKRIGSYDRGAVREIVEALISAGVAAGIAGSSRPCSGAEHLFSHYLDVVAPGRGLHGEKCGIGTIMIAKLHGLEWEKVRSALREVHAPISAAQIGVTEPQVVDALLNAPSIRPDRFTILSQKKLSRERALELARSTGVV